ncbi:MAG: hydroxylamine oxidation protein HaoB [Xanthobacteraceae bacterium]
MRSFVPSKLGWRVAFGGALLFLGAGLVTAAALSWGEKEAPPYQRRVVTDKPDDKLAALAALKPGAAIETFDIAVPDATERAARGTVLRDADGSAAVVAWESTIGEPVLYQDISPDEERGLIEILRKHLPADAMVLAMPDTSRRLKAFMAIDAPLAAADDSATRMLPAPWQRQADVVRAEERRVMGIKSGAGAAALNDFLDAMLADDRYGVARLQIMARGRPAYVILHVRDAFSIGIARPDRLAIGIHDFPAGSQVHDALKLVRHWMKEKGHAAYVAIPKAKDVTRVFFLPDAKDKSTLLTRLLPFSAADLGSVAGTHLVYQHRGYWLYQLVPVADRPS